MFSDAELIAKCVVRKLALPKLEWDVDEHHLRSSKGKSVIRRTMLSNFERANFGYLMCTLQFQTMYEAAEDIPGYSAGDYVVFRRTHHGY